MPFERTTNADENGKGRRKAGKQEEEERIKTNPRSPCKLDEGLYKELSLYDENGNVRLRKQMSFFNKNSKFDPQCAQNEPRLAQTEELFFSSRL